MTGRMTDIEARDHLEGLGLMVENLSGGAWCVEIGGRVYVAGVGGLYGVLDAARRRLSPGPVPPDEQVPRF